MFLTTGAGLLFIIGRNVAMGEQREAHLLLVCRHGGHSGHRGAGLIVVRRWQQLGGHALM